MEGSDLGADPAAGRCKEIRAESQWFRGSEGTGERADCGIGVASLIIRQFEVPSFLYRDAEGDLGIADRDEVRIHNGLYASLVSIKAVFPENDRLAEETGYRLYYYSFMRPSFRTFRLDDDTPYRAEVIDTWNMTITDLGIFRGRFDLPLGAKQYMAVRLRRAE